jgi:hypothetical protein
MVFQRLVALIVILLQLYNLLESPGPLPASLPLARKEINQNVNMISAPLLEMFEEQDTQKQCRSASCLFRLVQDGKFMHYLIIIFHLQ